MSILQIRYQESKINPKISDLLLGQFLYCLLILYAYKGIHKHVYEKFSKKKNNSALDKLCDFHDCFILESNFFVPEINLTVYKMLHL